MFWKIFHGSLLMTGITSYVINRTIKSNSNDWTNSVLDLDQSTYLVKCCCNIVTFAMKVLFINAFSLHSRSLPLTQKFILPPFLLRFVKFNVVSQQFLPVQEDGRSHRKIEIDDIAWEEDLIWFNFVQSLQTQLRAWHFQSAPSRRTSKKFWIYAEYILINSGITQ